MIHILKVSFCTPAKTGGQPRTFSLARLASNKVIPARPGMRNQHVQLATLIKDNPVRPRRAACINSMARQDGELVPRPGGGKVEALVVVVLVRVAVCFMVSINRQETDIIYDR